jgi:predicted RNase H-like HicB family nuclease
MSDFNVEIEREEDGRWIGEVTELPGVLTYGVTRDEALARTEGFRLCLP